MWWIYALLSATFAALTAIFAKVGVKNVNPELATAIRAIIIVCITCTIAFFKNSLADISALSRQNLLYLALSGTATGLSWIFYFKALQTGKISQVAAVDKLSVALAIIFATVFLGESLTVKEAIGALLITSGTLVLIF